MESMEAINKCFRHLWKKQMKEENANFIKRLKRDIGPMDIDS